MCFRVLPLKLWSKDQRQRHLEVFTNIESQVLCILLCLSQSSNGLYAKISDSLLYKAMQEKTVSRLLIHNVNYTNYKC